MIQEGALEASNFPSSVPSLPSPGSICGLFSSSSSNSTRWQYEPVHSPTSIKPHCIIALFPFVNCLFTYQNSRSSQVVPESGSSQLLNIASKAQPSRNQKPYSNYYRSFLHFRTTPLDHFSLPQPSYFPSSTQRRSQEPILLVHSGYAIFVTKSVLQSW